MKTRINTTLIIVFCMFLFSLNLSAQTTAQVQNENKGKVDVYYFHGKTRCVTCRTVESEAKMNVEELFGGDVKFTAVNLDEKAGEAKGKELGVNSQMLLVVKGSQKIDLTTDGFLYAVTDPAKFRKVIEEKIKPLL
jgi:hypothetical protein